MDLKKNIWIIVAVVAVCLIGMNACSTYNTLVDKSETVDNAWAEVQSAYQRRFDLIPNLNKTVAAYAKHESETLIKVTEARSGLAQAVDSAQAAGVGNALANEAEFSRYNQSQSDVARALNVYVNAVTEAYPDLKADKNFREFQASLESTENRINNARNNYTTTVKDYNIKVRRFPGNIWAGMFGFDTKPQYQAETAAQSAPSVEF